MNILIGISIYLIGVGLFSLIYVKVKFFHSADDVDAGMFILMWPFSLILVSSYAFFALAIITPGYCGERLAIALSKVIEK